MPVDNVRIALGKSRLLIETLPGSALLDSVHRIFFVNVLGFEPLEGTSGYTFPVGPLATKTMREVIGYLDENNIGFSLDPRARRAMKSFEESHKRLTVSRIAGTRAKEHPANHIEVPLLVRPLKAYQVPAVAHLVAVEGAANFSVPGSGKTAIVLAAFSILKERGEVDGLMVIGPRAS